jgi:hypothetical protein
MIKLPIIKLEDCKDSYLYFIDARRASIGIYSKKDLGFITSRDKFGSNFLSTEFHYDIGKIVPEMTHYGTASPIKEIEFVPEMNDRDKLKFLNEKRKELSEERNEYLCEPDNV